jgi:protein gp37
MADNTKIEWTDSTWNPVVGCSKISEGCENCYAEKMACRLAAMGNDFYDFAIIKKHWSGTANFVEPVLEIPLHWKRPRKIFVCSMGDLFHESVPFEWVDKVMAIVQLCPQHTFQVLTKRPVRMAEYFKTHNLGLDTIPFPLPNLWLGVTAENQRRADERIPLLLQIPAAVRFVSCEPLLGPIDFRPLASKGYTILSRYYSSTGFDDKGSQPERDRMCNQFPKIDWIIVGGETGPGARAMHPDWVRSIRDQCKGTPSTSSGQAGSPRHCSGRAGQAGVPLYFKGWGEWLPASQISKGQEISLNMWPHRVTKAGDMLSENIFRVGKKKAGYLLDGVAAKLNAGV